MDGQGGAVFRVTGRCWVGTGGAVPEVREGGSGPGGRDAKLPRSKVGEGDGAEDGGHLARLAVGWDGVCMVASTQISLLESKAEDVF